MRAALIIKLIEAHCVRDEKAFETILKNLVEEEQKKGNHSLSTSLLNAYSQSNIKAEPTYHKKTAQFFQASGEALSRTPRDRDSSFELYDLIYPEHGFSEVILPPSQEKLLNRIVTERKEIDKLRRHSIKPTTRILLCGPPGCGKTITAYAIAYELNLPVAYVRLDGLISSFLGQTSTNLRKIFDSVKGQNVLLFLDEFDAIAKKRDDNNELGELKRVVNTLIQNMDSLDYKTLIVAATNHHHLLDPAIWRRFDICMNFDYPAYEQRKKLLNKYLKKYNHTVDSGSLAELLEGMSGADIENIIEDAIKESFIKDGLLKLEEDNVIIALYRFLTLNKETDSNKDVVIGAVKRLAELGVSQRRISKVTGVPRSTIGNWIKKEELQSE